MKMGVAINKRNAASIEKVIRTIEGSSDIRPLTYEAMAEACKAAENVAGISKADLSGTEILVDVNAGVIDERGPMSTIFRASKTPGGWRLIELTREFSWKAGPRGKIFYSDKAKAAIISRFIKME